MLFNDYFIVYCPLILFHSRLLERKGGRGALERIAHGELADRLFRITTFAKNIVITPLPRRYKENNNVRGN